MQSQSLSSTTFDPTTIGVGARALGMGRAYIAVAEDADILFSNPAGLGQIDNFAFTSMSGKILEEVNYTMVGGTYPIDKKLAMGVGYLTSGVSGIAVRDASGTLQNYSNFENSVVFLSLGKIINERLSAGINLKYFSQNASNNETKGAGWNADLGFLHKGLDWLSLALVGQNILGNKIKYNDGEEEALPTCIKAGAQLHLLGEKFSAAIIAPYTLDASLEFVKPFSQGQSPTAHLGLEFYPISFFCLRAGLDQDPIPGGVANNPTAGLSLLIGGVGFHYAYHTYADTQTSSSFFSLSFSEKTWSADEPTNTFITKYP